MTQFHVFNGDADGICSMIQLYRANPQPDAIIVTGRKRDINLLDRVITESQDKVTVLDISMRSNMQDLKRILESGADVFYADHHNAGDIPEHENLNAFIDTSPEMCTAVLVDEHLSGAYKAWAVTAAFGDNFPNLAKAKAQDLNLPLEQLERLGILLNYNGYGASVEDLHFNPAELYKELRDFDTPMEFLENKPHIYAKLDKGYETDMQNAQSAKVINETSEGLVLELSDSASSRRVSGVYGNKLAQEFPQRAHALLTKKSCGNYLVSVRAPLSNRQGADTLCLQFETGGGRSAAAGINHLAKEDLNKFISAFQAAFK